MIIHYIFKFFNRINLLQHSHDSSHVISKILFLIPYLFHTTHNIYHCMKTEFSITLNIWLKWRRRSPDILPFYIHGSAHRESNLIIVQQDATVFSLLYFCMQLYMSRVLTPIVRSSWWWVSTPETSRAAYKNIINWIQSHLVGQL